MVWLREDRVKPVINSLTPGSCGSNFLSVIPNTCFELTSSALLVKLLSGECHRKLLISQVKTRSGNGMVPSGYKPSPEPFLTQIYGIKSMYIYFIEFLLIKIAYVVKTFPCGRQRSFQPTNQFHGYWCPGDAKCQSIHQQLWYWTSSFCWVNARKT